ncbi:MAG: peptide chain release factor N(5)-glutamine methyltransferase [Nitrospira sp.]|nr:peptide chain release factor N(5)-glutamine methyltransferase [Nitrospira sp.]
MAESKTIEALVVWIRHALEQAGVETAAQESRWLVAHALELESHHLASKAQEPVSAEQWAQAVSLASRRAAREPLQYILGTQEFCGLEFQVSPAVLIPRPETEVLVQEAVRAVDLDKESVLVDVGTGSGCVAVALAAILGNARIVAVDRSPQALVVAKGNAERHAVAEKIEWMESDLLSALRERGMAGTVDIIVSNPPYIAEADWAKSPCLSMWAQAPVVWPWPWQRSWSAPVLLRWIALRKPWRLQRGMRSGMRWPRRSSGWKVICCRHCANGA